MITKAELREYRNIKKLIEDLEEELAELEEIKYYSNSSAAALNGMPKADRISDPTGAAAALNVKIYELEQNLMFKRIEYVEQMNKIIKEIYSNKLTAIESRILAAYYIRGLKWEQVALEVAYSVNHVWRIHGRALEKLCCNID